MAGRACETCGAAVPVLADLCPGCGADPEIRLVDVGALAPLRRGGRPATGGGRGAGRRPPSRSPWPIVAMVAVVAVVVGVLLSAPGGDGGESDDGRAADAEPATTTTTRRSGSDETEASAGAPRPELDTGLFVASQGGPVVLHLDTGRELPLRTSAVGAHDGRLLVDTGAGLAWWPPPFDGTRAELVAEGVGTGRAWIDPVDGGVWTLGFGLETRLVFIGPDGSVTVDRPLSALWPVGVAGGRLVLDGPGGTFTIDRDGTTDLLSAGTPVAAAGESVAVVRCDDALVCQTEVLDASGAPTGRVLAFLDQSGAAQMSSTGRLATVRYDPGGAAAVLVDGEVVIDEPEPYVSSVAWSPDGRYLLVGTADEIVVIDLDSGVIEAVPVSSANLQTDSLVVLDGG